MNLLEHFREKVIGFLYDTPLYYVNDNEILVPEITANNEEIGSANIIIAQHYIYYYITENEVFEEDSDFEELANDIYKIVIDSLLEDGIISTTPEYKRSKFKVISNES